jgi:hypothetical protein
MIQKSKNSTNNRGSTHMLQKSKNSTNNRGVLTLLEHMSWPPVISRVLTLLDHMSSPPVISRVLTLLEHMSYSPWFMVQPFICRSFIGTIFFKIINLWWSHFIGTIFLIINLWCIHLYVYLGVLLVAFFNLHDGILDSGINSFQVTFVSQKWHIFNLWIVQH